MELAMIRDTSAQDQALAVPRHRRWTRWGAVAAGAALLVAVSASLVSGWNAGATSVNAARLRIAPVTRGPLVRDAAVGGRVVAAVSPTLYAAAPATVLLKVNAGDTPPKRRRWRTATSTCRSAPGANSSRASACSFRRHSGGWRS